MLRLVWRWRCRRNQEGDTGGSLVWAEVEGLCGEGVLCKKGAHQKKPVNDWNETRCPNDIPSSLGYALTKSLSLPGSKMDAKMMQSRGALGCASLILCDKRVQDVHSKSRVTTTLGDEIPSPVTQSNILASHWISWGTPCSINGVV